MSTTWNSADKSSGITLSGGDLAATTTGTGVLNVRATPVLSGKSYFEVKFTTAVGGAPAMVGVASSSEAIGSLPDQSFGYNASGGIYFGVSVVDTDTALAQGDVWCFAVDAPNGRMWARRNNGVWNKSATADPGSNPIDYVTYGDVGISGTAAAWAVFSGASGVAVTLQSAAYSVPSGYTDIVASSGSSVAPGKGSLAYTGYAPSLVIPTAYAPGKGALAYTGYAPTLIAASNVAPGKGALTYTGYQPSVSGASSVAPGKGSLVYTGYAPTLLSGSSVAPGKGSLTYTGHAPTLVLGSSVAPGKGTLAYTGYAPTVTNSGFVVRPGKGTLTYRGFAPTLVGLRRAVQLIPPMQNLDLVRQRANTILEYLQRALVTYSTALPPVADYSDGALFADTKAKKLYQVQDGAWVELFAKSFVIAYVTGTVSPVDAGTVIFGNEGLDTLGEYDPATSIFTARTAGVYRIHAVVSTDSLAAGKFFGLQVDRSTATMARGNFSYNDSASARPASCEVDAIVQMIAGQQLKVQLNTDTGGAITLRTAINSLLEIHQL